MCYPEWPQEKVRSTARKVFEHFGKTSARFFWEVRMSDEEIVRSVNSSGLEHIDAALEKGKGVVLITAHFGNWERMAQYIVRKGYKFGVVARDANEKRTTELVNNHRSNYGVEVFARGKAAREILRRLERNQMVGITPDQNTREILVPFFGYPAGTNEGPAAIALRTGAAIVTAFCKENEGGSYDLTIRPFSMPTLTGKKEDDIAAIMAGINSAIEETVRETPHQWLWMHDRWRWARQLGLLPAEFS
jgi:KDO2-lipid IV(A) lauroyltransferase